MASQNPPVELNQDLAPNPEGQPASPALPNMALENAEDIMSKYCDLNSRLTTYLVDCGKGVIRSSQVRIIFQLVFSIIDERGLVALDSKDIIVCDLQMRRLTNMPHLHLQQLKSCLLSLLTISEEGRRSQNQTDSFKIMLNRIFPKHPVTRETGAATPIEVVHPTQSEVKWIMQDNLSLLLLGFISTVPVEFNAIVSLMNKYISTHKARLLHPMNLSVACIRLDSLYDIFKVSYVHHSQLRGYLRDHVNPVDMD